MWICPKVRGIAAHCVRLCPRNGETTTCLTAFTINCSNNMCRLQAGALRLKNLQETPDNTNQRFEVFIYK